MSDKIAKIAHPVVNPLSKLESIVAILCFGSYAFNTYDQHSDIDLFVVCDPDILPETTRAHVFEGIPGVSGLQLNCSSPGWANQWSPQADSVTVAQTDFDLSYNTRDWLSGVVDKVIEEGATSIPELTFRPYTMLGLLANAIVLYDRQGYIQELTSRLYPYPPKLKSRLIDENLAILTDRLNELRDCARREISQTTFLFHLLQACDALVSLLFAFNERYVPATKRPEQALRTLNRGPANLVVRYEKLLEGPFDRDGKQRVVGGLAGLVEETIQLVKED